MSNRWFFEPRRRFAAALAIVAALLTAAVANAQIALPGSVAPEPEGSVAQGVVGHAARARSGRGSGAFVRKKPRPKAPRAIGGGDAEDRAARGPAIAPKAVTDDAIIGKTLYLDGARSVAEFQGVIGDTRISRLTLIGDRISRSGETCRVEVSAPLKLTPSDGDAGLRRYKVDFPACPFSFDVLDGAILVTNEGGACLIKAADCRVDPNGLWGEKDFDEKRGKQMLNTRARVEKTVRADFRLLYTQNKKDKPLRKLLVREQAGFSSRREEICRNYAQEADYGYCALRVTEARALILGTEVAEGVKRPPDLPLEEEPRKKVRRR